MEDLKLENGIIIKGASSCVPFGDTYLYECAICGKVESFQYEHKIVHVADANLAYICDDCFDLLPKRIRKAHNKAVHRP